MENPINNKEQPDFESKIEFAKEGDVEGILSVQESVLLSNKDLDQDPGKSGFLATKINRDVIERAIADNLKESFLIVTKNGNGDIAGYFLAYDLGKWIKENPSWVLKTGIDPKIVKDNKIMYGKHVASNRTVPGIGRKLDNHLFDFSKNNGYSLYIGEICEAPVRNNKSISLHTGEFNMKKISQYKDGEYTFGVYIKNL